MEKPKSALQGKKLPLFLLAASVGIFNILYLCVIFYVPFQSAFGFTNEQMGLLLGAYAIIAVPGYFLGGIICDMFNPKYLVVFACLFAGGCGFLLSTFPSFEVTRIIYFLLAIPCGICSWAPYCKCVGIMGTNEEQGRLFGTANTIDGILTCVFTLGLTAIFGDAMGTQAGFRVVILVLSAFYFLTGIGVGVFYDYKKWAQYNAEAASAKAEKLTLKGFIDVIKLPFTWVCGFMVMGTYIASSCMTYLSPYLNAVYVVPVGLASAFGVITRYGVKIVAAPIGGNIRDKKFGGSTSKLAWLATAGMVFFVVILMIMPKTQSFCIPAVVVALLAIFSYRLNNSSESTVYRQLKSTPAAMLGTIIGFASLIGYSSDLWLPTIIGKIIDTNGTAGYTYVFIIMIAAMVFTSLNGIILYRWYKKEKAQEIAS